MIDKQQLVARIKRSSKYSHQAPSEGWFAAEIIDAQFDHVVYGNDNCYRFADVSLGVVVGGAVIELAGGKKINTDVAGLRSLADA